MQILVVSQYWEPENGVPQRRWAWLSQLLQESGHSVTVIAPPPHYDRKLSLKEWWVTRKYRSAIESSALQPNIRVVRSGFIPSGNSISGKVVNQLAVAFGAIWLLLRLPGRLKGYRPDLVVGTVPALPTALVARIASFRFRRPYMIDLRDAWPDLLSESRKWNAGLGSKSWREKVFGTWVLDFSLKIVETVLNSILQKASALTVTSARLQESLLRRTDVLGSKNEDTILVVRNVFEPKTNADFLGNRYRDRPFLNVLYAGTLGRAQNLSNAVKAIKVAQDQGYEIHLRFIGAGAAKKELIHLARELDVDVSFEAKVQATQLADAYHWADTALVHLTDWPALERTVPSKLYELMSVGMHVTGVVSGETAELIKRLNAGVVVQTESPEALAETWIELIKHPEKRFVTDQGFRWVELNRQVESPTNFLRAINNALGSSTRG